jgi:hypothetical protein
MAAIASASTACGFEAIAELGVHEEAEFRPDVALVEGESEVAEPFVKAVRALFNANFERYLMHFCRTCVADELCQPGNLAHYGVSRHEELGYSDDPVAGTERSSVSSGQTNNNSYSRCSRSYRRCRPYRPPNWWRYLLACSAEKKDKLEFRNHHAPFAPPSCGAFFVAGRCAHGQDRELQFGEIDAGEVGQLGGSRHEAESYSYPGGRQA